MGCSIAKIVFKNSTTGYTRRKDDFKGLYAAFPRDSEKETVRYETLPGEQM
jgi:hypothetical protein